MARRTKKEIAETALRDRNFWDHIHARNLMSVISNGRAGLWRGDLLEAHQHLVWHFAHDENDRLDFYKRHNIRTGRIQPREEQCNTTA